MRELHLDQDEMREAIAWWLNNKALRYDNEQSVVRVRQCRNRTVDYFKINLEKVQKKPK